MNTNNYYLKVLLHLKQFEGDGLVHEIESIFANAERNQIENILRELSCENYIRLEGGNYGMLPIMYFPDDVQNNPENYSQKYVPFSASITPAGIKYLKELLTTNSNYYSINLGPNSNLIINSPGAAINNNPEIIKLVQEIIKTLENDSAINNDDKTEAVQSFQQLETEIKSGNAMPSTFEKIITLGEKISSIGSFVITLVRLFSTNPPT